MDFKITHFEKFNDHRGQLVVFLKKTEIAEKDKTFGQIYFVTFKKAGTIRGNHYHKKWREWFGIVSGKIEVFLEDVLTGERVTLFLDADVDRYVRLEIGPNIAHTFKSVSEYAALLNYANGEWNKRDDFDFKVVK